MRGAADKAVFQSQKFSINNGLTPHRRGNDEGCGISIALYQPVKKYEAIPSGGWYCFVLLDAKFGQRRLRPFVDSGVGVGGTLFKYLVRSMGRTGDTVAGQKRHQRE